MAELLRIWIDGVPRGGDPRGAIDRVLGWRSEDGWEGVFSTARLDAGRLVLSDLHFERLRLDGGRLGFDEADLDQLLQELAGDLERILASEGAFQDAAVCRLVIGRQANTLHRAVVFEPPRVRRWKDGPGLALAPAHPLGWLPAIKSIHRREMTLLERQAQAEGADGALMVDAEGHVLEGTWFHLFAHLDGAWVTPPLADALLFGTTRAALLRGLAQGGSPVAERPLPLPELLEARAVVVCSALVGIVPVVRVGSFMMKSDTGLAADLTAVLAQAERVPVAER